MELPPGARRFGVQFRWWQPYHSGRGHDVWAVDEITMTSVLFNTISLDFSNVLDVTQSLGFYLGHVQPYCQHDWTLRYTKDKRFSLSGLQYFPLSSGGERLPLEGFCTLSCGAELHTCSYVAVHLSGAESLLLSFLGGLLRYRNKTQPTIPVYSVITNVVCTCVIYSNTAKNITNSFTGIGKNHSPLLQIEV